MNTKKFDIQECEESYLLPSGDEAKVSQSTVHSFRTKALRTHTTTLKNHEMLSTANGEIIIHYILRVTANTEG